MELNRKTAGVVMALFGALFTVIGSILPWAKVESMFGSVSKAGIDGDGKITLVIGIVGLMMAVWAGFSDHRSLTIAVLGIGLAGAIVAISAIDLNNASRILAEASNKYAIASVGAGLYLVLAGGLVYGIGISIGELGSFKRPGWLFSMTCPNCFEDIPSDSLVCPNCGMRF